MELDLQYQSFTNGNVDKTTEPHSKTYAQILFLFPQNVLNGTR
jgi:hypothetical protein